MPWRLHLPLLRLEYRRLSPRRHLAQSWNYIGSTRALPYRSALNDTRHVRGVPQRRVYQPVPA